MVNKREQVLAILMNYYIEIKKFVCTQILELFDEMEIADCGYYYYEEDVNYIIEKIKELRDEK